MRPMRSKRTPGGGYRKSVNGGYTGAGVGPEGEGPRRRDWFPSAGEMVTLVADAAQKGNKILDALAEKKARILYANLQIGDYQITDNIYISYMTSDEFVRALTDKRLYRQVLELKRACPEPMVIVEGPSVYDNPATNTNIINGALAFISVLNRIPVVFTADAEESADILFMATNQMQFGLGYEVHAEDQRKRKREFREIQHDVLTTLPGIGPNLAKVLLKQFGSLQAVFNATPEALAEVQGFEDGQRETLIELFTQKG